MELVACLLLMAILSLAAVVLLRGAGQTARFEDVVQQFASADSMCRDYSRRFGRDVEFVIDLDAGTLFRHESDAVPARLYTLPRGFGIAGAWGLEGQVEQGTVRVQVNSGGRAITYGLALSGPEGRKRWILVAGLTGSVVECGSEDEWQTMLGDLETVIASR